MYSSLLRKMNKQTKIPGIMFWSHLRGSEGFTPSYFNEDFFLFSRGESQIHRPVVEGELFAPV